MANRETSSAAQRAAVSKLWAEQAAREAARKAAEAAAWRTGKVEDAAITSRPALSIGSAQAQASARAAASAGEVPIKETEVDIKKKRKTALRI